MIEKLSSDELINNEPSELERLFVDVEHDLEALFSYLTRRKQHVGLYQFAVSDALNNMQSFCKRQGLF